MSLGHKIKDKKKIRLNPKGKKKTTQKHKNTRRMGDKQPKHE